MDSLHLAGSAADSSIDVELHYDHRSRTPHACSPVFDGVLPGRYPSREAAADAVRTMLANAVAQDGSGNFSRRTIRVWFR